MKISNSKRELARIISENGGWRSDNYAVQDKDDKNVWFVSELSGRPSGKAYWPGHKSNRIACGKLLPNWHQTILSREEYFHIYPATDADGWIEWKGGGCPVDDDCIVSYKMRNAETFKRGETASEVRWTHNGSASDIIAYRLHKPEQAEPEFCKSVMRSISEPEAKTTIEQLATDYRNAKDYAERKQEEADNAKADADAKLKALELAGEALGLLVAPITAKKEPELAITDWRDLRVGDEVEAKCYAGVMIGFITEMEPKDYDGERPFRFQPPGEGSKWCTSSKFRFIRRP